ncbi:hypothetical protein GCM10010451_38200 [Streptomyces virens]|uniref:Uncharacterized protein n=1 Tax=Streptomyces virens TaxID=285572 RepID=A0ABP6PQ17_9ACTN
MVGAEADLIRLCERAGLGDTQRALLEAVLAASDPQAVLTQHVTSVPTAVAAVARAQSALESRGRPDRSKLQPYTGPTLDLVSDAREALEELRPHIPAGPLDGAVDALKNIEARGRPGLNSAADCAAQAHLLAGWVTQVCTAVADGFAEAWQGAGHQDARERLALEMAALCVIEGRQHQLLNDDVRTELSRGNRDADSIKKALLPVERDLRVAVVVEGTSRLESLTGLMGPAAAAAGIAPGAPVVGWGRATADFKALADLAEAACAARRAWSGDQASGYTLLAFTVRARDLGAAALLGRRQASEALDQYVAGQRLAEIRLRPETLAHDPHSGRGLKVAVPVLGSGPVRPLTTNWPATLRESLRTAHVARVTEAPTTAAGLCWAALEALDVKSQDTGILGRALSLQAFRQQVIDLQQRTRTAAAAAVSATRTAHRAAQRAADQLEAAASSAKRDHAAKLAEKAAQARASELQRHAALKRALETESHHAVVDAWTGIGNDGKLRDPDRWLDVITSPADADPALRAAADALAAVNDRIGGDTAKRLRNWRTRLSDLDSLADWIEETAARFEKNLDWLYALRNTALHDGRFTSATDLLDVHGGRALVDLTLEFLGNWYRHEGAAAPEQSGLTAREVIAHLADRQQALIAEMKSGKPTPWNVTRLTSPTPIGSGRA